MSLLPIHVACYFVICPQKHPDKPTMEPVRCWDVLPDIEHLDMQLVSVVCVCAVCVCAVCVLCVLCVCCVCVCVLCVCVHVLALCVLTVGQAFDAPPEAGLKKRRQRELAPPDAKRLASRAVVCSPAEAVTQARGLLAYYYLPDSLESCEGDRRKLEFVRDYNLTGGPVCPSAMPC